MGIREIAAYYAEDTAAVREILSSSLKSDVSLLDGINSALLGNSGKMLRPLMTTLAARACGEKAVSHDALLYAAAAELLHNATLMHDDVIDGAEVRRGRPSVASMLSPKGSVLIGDWWLVKAVGNILSAGRGSEEVIRIYAKTISDLAEAELLQMQKASDGSTDENDYFRIIYGKTASLFEASAAGGAVASGASEDELDAVREYAVNAGLAFQIKDDIFDYGDGAFTGKPSGIDLKEQKITLPLLGALREVGDDEAARIREAVSTLACHPEKVAEIRDFVIRHNGIAYAENIMNQYIAKAEAALGKLSPSKAREDLGALAKFFGERKL